jgi:ATP-dependent Zn protease
MAALHALAEALIEKETVDGSLVKEIIEKNKP